ncbi:recombinase family protein [Cyanobacteria bacterium FACHB-DQ100]|nr:recombinase family protein [Cyanobacteria bacterium FACHB-DQ100]
MRIVGYVRLSKTEQANGTHTLDNQTRRLKEAGANEIITEISSGTSGKRKKFEKLRQDVRDKKVDQIVVTRVDRLSRRAKVLHDLKDEMAQNGVILRAIDQAIDTSVDTSSIALNLFIAMAETEADNISNRTRHGWEALRERREAMHPPFGYLKGDKEIVEIDNKKVETRRHKLDKRPFLCLLEERPKDFPMIDTSEWSEDEFRQWKNGDQNECSKSRYDAARYLVENYLKIKSIRQTIRAFNRNYGIQTLARGRTVHSGFDNEGIFQRSPSGFAKWITNPVLRGHLVYFNDSEENRKPLWGTHQDQRLITEEESQRIQAIIQENKESHGFTSNIRKHPLSGLVKCEVCGRNLYYSKAGKGTSGRRDRDYYYYYCQRANLGSCNSGVNGTSNYIRADYIEDQIVGKLKRFAIDFREMAEKPIESPVNPEILKKQDEIKKLEPLKKDVPEVALAIERLTNEIKGLTLEKQTEELPLETKARILGALRDKRFWQRLTDDQKYFIYRDLISKIFCKPSENQDFALTNNKPVKRKRSVVWDVNVIVSFDKLPSKVLSEAVEEFLSAHDDVESVYVREFNTTLSDGSVVMNFNLATELQKELEALQRQADEMNERTALEHQLRSQQTTDS